MADAIVSSTIDPFRFISHNSGMPKGMTLLERLLRLTVPEPNTGCWLWMGAVGHKGYGSIWDGSKGRFVRAHRVSYELHVGPIPEGLQIDHLCRVRCCINPNHLEPVTQSVNQIRGLNGVLRTPTSHCPHGHPMTAENTGVSKGRFRYCRACKTLRTPAIRRYSKNQIVQASQSSDLTAAATVSSAVDFSSS